MTTPCWKWIRISDFRVLEAMCSHGNCLTPNGHLCDQLVVTDEGGVVDLSHPGEYGRLPYRVRLWNKDCGCNVDVLIDQELRVYWLSELCVREAKVE